MTRLSRELAFALPVQFLDPELPIAGDVRPEFCMPSNFPFSFIEDIPSSLYKLFSSIYSITGDGIKYLTETEEGKRGARLANQSQSLS
jgi:hypothetical protein